MFHGRSMFQPCLFYLAYIGWWTRGTWWRTGTSSTQTLLP